MQHVQAKAKDEIVGLETKFAQQAAQMRASIMDLKIVNDGMC